MMAPNLKPDKWAQTYYELFDPSERDHGIAALKQWTESVKRNTSQIPWAVETIDDCLIAPLQSYLVEKNSAEIARFDKEREYWKKQGIENHPVKRLITTSEKAAVKFSTAAYDVREAWQQNKLSPARINHLFAELERTWTEFIIQGSAHLMYYDLPTKRKQNSESAKVPRIAARKIDRVALDRAAATYLATGTEKQNLVSKLAQNEKFPFSKKAIRDALSPKFKKKGS